MSLDGPDLSVLMTLHSQGAEIFSRKEDPCGMESSDDCKQTAVKESDAFHAQECLYSLMGKEKQILADPISLKPPTKTDEVHNRSSAPSKITTSPATAKMLAALALHPAKPRFISSSLPCSVTSSPQSGLALLKSRKKLRNQSQSSTFSIGSLALQHTDVVPSHLSQEPESLRRSKSCGEGRACPPSDEFDLFSRKADGLFDENGVGGYYKCNDNEVVSAKKSESRDESFKCGALCLFLPSFSSKAKQVKPKREGKEDEGNIASRVVSLEKFECGSWSSSAITDGDECNESARLYFDLPLELIRNSANDTHSPVTTAFIFNSERKGRLKKNTSGKSHESVRHVRFSTSAPISHPSSPSSFCISPRLRKARDEFNAYLEEAQRT